MKKFISISMVIVLLVSMSVTAVASSQLQFTETAKRGWYFANEGSDGNVFVPKDKYNPDHLITYTYSSKTTFEGNEEKAKKILDSAKTPGMGVRALHKEGLTGKGVSIAYINHGIQGGNLDNFKHPEFRDGMIKEYVNLGHGNRGTSGFAYANISALAGKTVGTAPGVNLYYLGVGGIHNKNSRWEPIINGIDWVINKNKSLSKADRIKVIAVDTWGFGYDDGVKPYYEAVKRAEKSGIIILGPVFDEKALAVYSLTAGIGYYDAASPNNVDKAMLGWPDRIFSGSKSRKEVYVPSARRTAAWVNDEYIYVYASMAYYNQYLAGIIALGYQANPNITKEQLTEAMIVTTTYNLMVNPPAFIEAVKKAK